MVGAYGVSARTGAGMADLAEGLLRDLGGRDVFVVGAANAGKSTLVKGLSSLLARTLRVRGRSRRADNRRRDELQNLRVTASHLPGTTLQAVRIPCFPSTRHALWDTPGIIKRSSLEYALFPSHLMEPLAFPTPIGLPKVEEGTRCRVRAGQSVLIEARWVENGEEETEGNSSPLEEGKLSPTSPRKDDQRKGTARPDGANPDEIAAPFTLARLDIVEDDGWAIKVLAFVPSCLRVRVVPTSAAPARATIPDWYVAKVRKLVGDAGNFDECDTSRPLVVFKQAQALQEGAVTFDQSKEAASNGWISRDIVFMNLGWLMLNARRSFTVRPWCVNGSLWSKRRAMYPSNIADVVEVEDEWDGGRTTLTPPADPDDEEMKWRLQQAAEKGRHAAGLGTKVGRDNRDRARGDIFDNDVWGEGDRDAEYW